MPVNPFGDPEFMQLLGASMFGAISPDGRANFATPAINAWMTGKQLAQEKEIWGDKFGLSQQEAATQERQRNRQLGLQEEAQRRLERERQDQARYRDQSHALDREQLSFSQRKQTMELREKEAYEKAAGQVLKNFISPELADQYVAAGMAAETLDTYTRDSLKKEEAKTKLYQTFVEALQYAQVTDPGSRRPRQMTPEEIDKKAREMSGYNPQVSGNSNTIDFSAAFGGF